MQLLKQSTAVTLKIGVFVDDGDGKTLENGLTISQADVLLSKNGGAFAQKNEATACTVDGTTGWYGCPVNGTDTNTLGRLQLIVNETGALSVFYEYMVVPANVWDSLLGSDKLQVHAAEITADLITAAIIATGAIDANAIAADAINAASIKADAVTKIAAGVGAKVIDGTVDMVDVLARVNAYVRGKTLLSGLYAGYYGEDGTTRIIYSKIEDDGRTPQTP